MCAHKARADWPGVIGTRVRELQPGVIMKRTDKSARRTGGFCQRVSTYIRNLKGQVMRFARIGKLVLLVLFVFLL